MNFTELARCASEPSPDTEPYVARPLQSEAGPDAGKPRIKFSWPEPACERLKELFAEGLTHAAMGEKLSVEFSARITERSVKAFCLKNGMSRNHQSQWTPAMDDALRAGLAAGKYYRTIGEELGVSRNAAIGRAHRLGIFAPRIAQSPEEIERAKERRRQQKNAARRKSPRVRLSAVPKAEIIMRCAEVEPLHVSLADLEPNGCRWPYGDGPFTFCGRENLDNKSYCGAHFLLSLGTGSISEQHAHKVGRRHLEGA